MKQGRGRFVGRGAATALAVAVAAGSVVSGAAVAGASTKPSFSRPPVAIPGVAVTREGNGDEKLVYLPIYLSHASKQEVLVHFTTKTLENAPGHQADSETDYSSQAGSIVFEPGQTKYWLPLTVRGGTEVEPTEYFALQFWYPQNATVGGFHGLGFVFIVNDD